MTPRIDRRLRRRARFFATSLLAVGALTAAPHAARAAVAASEGARIFRLPSEPLTQALERFALQAGVSVGLAPGARCSGKSRSVAGSMTPGAALRRLLPDRCRAERLDPGGFVVLGPGARPPVAAEQAATPTPKPLEELVVTAERRPELLSHATYAVSALDREELRRLGGGSFHDLALQLVGVTVTNLGSGRNKIFIRGLSDGSFTGNTQSTVGLYLDDTPITYDAPDPDLRLVDIDRVEVLRGPQGTLYGSGSIGGIVRLVTAKPDPLAFGGDVAVHAGVTEHGAPSGGVDAWLNLPLLQGAAALRGVAYWEDRGGYLDNPRLGLHDVNDDRRSGARLAALARLSEDWTLGAALAHQSISAADAQYTVGASQLVRDTAVREPHDNDFTQASATLAHAGAAELKITAAYTDHDLATRYDATSAYPPPISGVASVVDESQRVKLWLGEATLTRNGHGLAGLYLGGGDEADAALLTPGPDAPRQLYTRRDRHAEAALYGEATYQLSRRIAVTAGGRLFARRLSTEAEGPGGSAPPARLSAHRTDQGFAGKLRVSYALSPGVAFYAQVQDGYRPAGFNIPGLSGPDPAAPHIPKVFEPDRLRSYELGGEAALLRGALRLRWDVFHADWRRVQTDQFVAGGLPITVNIGDGANTGLEAEALWSIGERLQVRAEAMLDDPQLTRTSHLFPALPDVGLPGVPYQTGALDVRYRWRLGDAEAAVSAQGAYVGRSYLSFSGEAANGMGGYAVARLQGELTASTWRFSAWIDNLTGQRADTFAFGNPFSRPLSRQATPLRPRSLTVSVSRTF